MYIATKRGKQSAKTKQKERKDKMNKLMMVSAAIALLGGAAAYADDQALPSASGSFAERTRRAKAEQSEASSPERSGSYIEKRLAKEIQIAVNRELAFFDTSLPLEDSAKTCFDEDGVEYGLDAKSEEILKRMKESTTCVDVDNAPFDQVLDQVLRIMQSALGTTVTLKKSAEEAVDAMKQTCAWKENNVTIYNLLLHVCRKTGYTFDIKNGSIVIGPLDAMRTWWTLNVDKSVAVRLLGLDGRDRRYFTDYSPRWMEFLRNHGLEKMVGSGAKYNVGDETLCINSTRRGINGVRWVLDRSWKRACANEAKNKNAEDAADTTKSIAPNVELQFAVVEASTSALRECGYYGADSMHASGVLEKLLGNHGATVIAAPRLLSTIGEKLATVDAGASPSVSSIDLSVETAAISLRDKVLSVSVEFRQSVGLSNVSESRRTTSARDVSGVNAKVVLMSGTTAMFTASSNNKDKIVLVFVKPVLLPVLER